ncbi:hypothetical protein OG599_25370 [Streptomyces sp. NBC_01335]|uniref:hypothetical protein n=1 Tax=Streptomyces sp. NBC_01335 TaxID=2903828 RepID=UPI002E15BFC4|nr:hypothetical protein OG599_25370 [Streptomyces sp. NBC_01335]
MHRDLVGALDEGELQPLRDWLSSRQVDTGTLHELPQWDSSRFPELLPSSRRLADRTASANAEILAQLPKAAAAPGGVPLLLLFVFLSVEEEWERSYHYQPMWNTLQGVQDCLRDHGAVVRGEDAVLTRAVLALMESLSAQISAENAMTTGQSAAHEAALGTAAAKAREAAGIARTASAVYPELSTYLVGRAEECEAYNTVAGEAVCAVRDFLATGASLDRAIADLEAAEVGGEITEPVYVSELRAHRFSLMALNDARHDPWLRTDQGKIVYLYPFATRGATPQQVLDSVGAGAEEWFLGDVKPLSVSGSLKLDDVWDGSDAFKRHYDGSFLTLPQVVVAGVGGGELARLDAEIRFSKLGNHYVRFTTDITGVGPDELYAMMLRAAPEHGNVRVVFDGAPGREWPRLADLAVQLAEDTGRRLAETADTSEADVVARQGMFQLVVNVDAASTTPGPARSLVRREVRSAGDLLGAVGAQLLTNPVTFLIGALAEWIRYGTDNQLSSTTTGLIGERTVRTSNTTVIVAPGVAAFTQGTRASVAEFAASLDGLFAGWSVELADHYRRVDAIQEDVEAAESDHGVSAQALGTLERTLDSEKIRLNEFATGVRSTVALIRSPSLMASPVVADSLRLLLECCGFEGRVAELNAMIEEVTQEQLGVTIEKLARQREEQEAREEERRESVQRAKLEVFLAVIAAAGVSGIIQVLQAGFFGSDAAAVWAVGGVVGVVSLALVLGLVVWPRTQRNS